jgi:hypothetical protein
LAEIGKVSGQILQVIFGQELPDEATSFAQQAFAVSVAAIGLAAFALVLALVEQVVLQVVDENVARGSRVFETGHVRLSFLTFACTTLLGDTGVQGGSDGGLLDSGPFVLFCS